MKEQILNNWATILFNVAETAIVILLGLILKVKISNILLIIFLFGFTRILTKEGLHYKDWKKCLFWTTALMISLFLIANIDITIAIVTTMFSAFITSKKANIEDCFMYKRKDNSKYREMKKYINRLENKNVILKFEEILKEIELSYQDRYGANFYKIYKMYFIEDSTFKEIRDKLNLYDNHDITKALDMIFMSFNSYMIEIGEFDKLKEKKELTELS